MVQSELDSENIDFTVIDDVGSESLGPGIRRELSFSRWCDDDGRIHLDQQLGNEDVSVEDDSDFELPFPEKNEPQGRSLDRERFFHQKFQHRSMQMNGIGTMDDDSVHRRGNGSEKYVSFDIEDKSERGTNSLDSYISVGGDGSLGKISQNPIHAANILKTLILILMWYTSSLFLTLYNKSLLGDHMGKFPAPFLMNTIHFTMQAVLSKFITWFWSHKFEANVVISWRDYFLRDWNIYSTIVIYIAKKTGNAEWRLHIMPHSLEPAMGNKTHSSLASLFGSSSASNCLPSLHLVYSPHYRVYRSSLYMPKPPKSIFHHLLYNRRYSNPLSNSFVSNFILLSLTTHLPQHPHLRYTYFILMLALDRPTFCSVQNRRWTLPLTVVPTAFGTAMDVNLSNVSLVFISVTFATMCKSAAPIFLLLFAFAFRLETPSVKLLGIILIISVGILLTVAKETEFDFWGFVLVMLAAVMSGFRLKNPLVLMSYVTPVMAAATALLSLALDPWDEFRENKYFDNSLHITRSCLLMLLGGTLAFFMVLTEYVLVSVTSAVTVTIAGVVKEAVTILVAVLYFHDQFTWLKGCGLLTIMVGVSLFNWYKYLKLQKGHAGGSDVEEHSRDSAAKYIVFQQR
ncbi:putative sugar phosphate/phosphate translocator [Glycine soja]